MENQNTNIDYKYRYLAFFTPPFYIVIYLLVFFLLYNYDLFYEKKLNMNYFSKIECDFQYILINYNIFTANFYYNIFYIFCLIFVLMSFIGAILIHIVKKYFFRDMTIKTNIFIWSLFVVIAFPFLYLYESSSQKNTIGCTNFRLKIEFVRDFYPADISGALGRLVFYFWFLNMLTSYVLFCCSTLFMKRVGVKE